MPARRRLLAVALGLGLTTSLAACAAEPQEAATSRVTAQPSPAATAPARAAVSAACTAPPDLSARRVGDVIRVRWTAHVPASCGRAWLLITGHSTSIEAPALTTTEQDIDASPGTGEATIRLVVDHPPHVVRASLNMGRVVEVRVAGDRRAGRAEATEKRRSAACVHMLARRTTCRTTIDTEPLRDADPVALARDLRRAIEVNSWTTEALRCRSDGRCHGSFSLLHGDERVGMSYVVRAQRGTDCRVVASYSVTRPIPKWENTDPPAAFKVGCGPR